MARISYGSVTQNSVVLMVTELNTASAYSEIYITINGQTSPNLAWGGSGNYNSRQWQATGLSPGTTYYASYYISTGINSGSGGTYVTTQSPPLPVPTTPSYANLSTVSNNPNQLVASFGSSSYAVEYDIYLYCDGSYYASYISYSTTYTFSWLPTGHTWHYVVHGYNSSGSSNGRSSNTVKTVAPDTIAPTITYQSATGIGLLRLGWSAYDNTGGSGLSYYRTYIGTPNGDVNTLVAKETLSVGATSTEWTLDANNNALQVNMWYWVGVRVYDVAGNSSLLTYRIQFKRQIPGEWDWGLTFISGQSINLTASKWNDFTFRINQFRFYMGLTNYLFTTVYRGNPIYAWQINEAVNTINSMVSTKLTSQVSGGNALASFIDLLETRLNSIQ